MDSRPGPTGRLMASRVRMTALFILCLALVSVAQAETWRGVEVAPESRSSPYDRDDYPYSPAVEARILKRDGGVIRCRYTGQTFASLKGTDIEHVVALSEAHDSGLCAAPSPGGSGEPRAGRTAGESIREEHAAEWLPAQDRCWFAGQVVLVRAKYGLTVDRRERAALEKILTDCQWRD